MPAGSDKLAAMSLPLAITEGVSIILAMLCVGLIFLAVIGLGEWTHHYFERRAERRRARRAIY
jgi:peptidoglycan/LPS O-acetylase OafA/YrhL